MDGYGLTKADRDALAQMLREWKRGNGRGQQRAQPPRVRMEPPVVLFNQTSEEVPAYGCVQVASFTYTSQRVRLASIQKPYATNTGIYLVNVAQAIAPNDGASVAQHDMHVQVLYDSGTPKPGEIWGPKAGQFPLNRNGKGFRVIGILDADNKVMLAERYYGPPPTIALNVSGETIPAYSIVKLTRRLASSSPGDADSVHADGVGLEADKPDDETFFVGISPAWDIPDDAFFPVELDQGILKYTDTTLPRVSGATIGFTASSWEGAYTQHDFKIIRVINVASKLVEVQRITPTNVVQLRCDGTLYKETATGTSNKANTSCKGSLKLRTTSAISSSTEYARTGVEANTSQAAFGDNAFTITGGGRFILTYNIELRGHFTGTAPVETLVSTSDGGETVATGAASAGTAHTHDVTTNDHTHSVDVKLPAALAGSIYLQERENSGGTWASSGTHLNALSAKWTIQRTVNESPFSYTLSWSTIFTIGKRTTSDSMEFRLVIDPTALTSGLAAADFEVSVLDPSTIMLQRYTRF